MIESMSDDVDDLEALARALVEVGRDVRRGVGVHRGAGDAAVVRTAGGDDVFGVDARADEVLEPTVDWRRQLGYSLIGVARFNEAAVFALAALAGLLGLRLPELAQPAGGRRSHPFAKIRWPRGHKGEALPRPESREGFATKLSVIPRSRLRLRTPAASDIPHRCESHSSRMHPEGRSARRWFRRSRPPTWR